MSKRKQITRRPGRLAVERLEDRENPNGTVAASLTAGGVLFLRGDALDNDVRLQMTGAGAVVTGLNGTQISANGNVGGSATLNGQVKHINASLLAGNDSISIDAASAFAISGNAAFNLGAGNNSLDLTTSGALNIGGHLFVRAAAGTDTIAVRGGLGSAINGNAMIALGVGGSTVTIEDLSINGAAGLKIFAGAGVDSVTLDGVVLSRGSAQVSAGSDQLNVDLTGAINVAGRVGVSGTAGVDVDVAGGTFGSIFVAGGAGSAVTNVNIAGATNIATDLRVRGANATLDADAALSVGRHTVVTGANATFDATGASLSLGKNLFVSAGTKATVNLATSGNADIAGNLTVFGGIDGDDIDANANLTVNGNTALLLRGGNNDVSLGSMAIWI